MGQLYAPGPRKNILSGKEAYAPRPGDKEYISGNEGKKVLSGSGGSSSKPKINDYTSINIAPNTKYDVSNKQITDSTGTKLSKQQIQTALYKTLSGKKSSYKTTAKTHIEEKLIKPGAKKLAQYLKLNQEAVKAQQQAEKDKIILNQKLHSQYLQGLWGQGRQLKNMQIISKDINGNPISGSFMTGITEKDLENYQKFEKQYVEPLEKQGKKYLTQSEKSIALKTEYDTLNTQLEQARINAERQGLRGEDRFLYLEPIQQQINKIANAYNTQADITNAEAKKLQILDNKIRLMKQPTITIGEGNEELQKLTQDIFYNENYKDIQKEAMREQKYMDADHTQKKYGPEGNTFYQPAKSLKGTQERLSNVGRTFQEGYKGTANTLAIAPQFFMDTFKKKGKYWKPFKDPNLQVKGIRNQFVADTIKLGAKNPFATAGLLATPYVGPMAKTAGAWMGIGTGSAEAYRAKRRGKGFFNEKFTRQDDIKAREIMQGTVDASKGAWYTPWSLANEANMAIASKEAKKQAYDNVYNYFLREGKNKKDARYISDKAFSSFHYDAGAEFLEMFAGGIGTNKIGAQGIKAVNPYIGKIASKPGVLPWLGSRAPGMIPAGAIEGIYFGSSSMSNRYNRGLTPKEYAIYGGLGGVTALGAQGLIEFRNPMKIIKTGPNAGLQVSRKPGFYTKSGKNVPTKREMALFGFDPMEAVSDTATDMGVRVKTLTPAFSNPLMWGKGTSKGFNFGASPWAMSTSRNQQNAYINTYGQVMPLSYIQPYSAPQVSYSTSPFIQALPNTQIQSSPYIQSEPMPYINNQPIVNVNPYVNPYVNPNTDPYTNPTVLDGAFPGLTPGAPFGWNNIRKRYAKFKRVNNPYSRLFGKKKDDKNSIFDNKMMLTGFY